MLNNINIDNSIYYKIRDTMTNNGFIDASGNILPNIIDGDIAEYLLLQSDDGLIDLDTGSGIENILPAITIENIEESLTPGALGGTTWNNNSYDIFVFGRSQVESKRMAEAIVHGLKSGVTVYDYSLASPDASGFPLSGQLIGHFPVENIRNRNAALPSLSLLDSVRRDISFNITYLEN